MDESPRITWNQSPRDIQKTKPKLIAIEPKLIAIPSLSLPIGAMLKPSRIPRRLGQGD